MESRLVGADTARTAANPSGHDSGSRLRQIDILRLLICLCVLGRHAVIAQYAMPVPENFTERPVVDAVALLGHFARYGFFFVSALVLVRVYAHRMDAAGRLPNGSAVRWRRVRLIGVPFVLWSVIYLISAQVYERIHQNLTDATAQPWPRFIAKLPDRLVQALISGDSSYHLYFLVVTLQFTLVFPLFLRLLHRTRGRHCWLLAASFGLQILALLCYARFGMPGGTWKSILGDSSLVAYQFSLVAGGIAGLHVERIHAWLTGHRVLVVCALPVATGALLVNYRMRLDLMDSQDAADAMQPLVLVYAAVMVGVLYLAADWLAGLRAPRIRAVLDHGSRLSFGLYLAHPLVLTLVFVIWLQLGWSSPAAWQGVVAVVCTLVGTAALCMLLNRTRFSLPTIGRPRLERPVTSTEAAR